MTTENIDIRIREDGSRVVQRRLEDVGKTAEKSASGVDVLKRALSLLGGALAAREVLRLADTYTLLQNRLRSVGLEGTQLKSVYDELLRVSNETRASVEGSVELYARLALSSKELGVSQKQLIQFTTSLNQAITLSGASGAEAQAGLIQLSQGLASGVLRGDELRSVLEQLPAVADVIAKGLGVTRGQLRALGEDGKITAKVVLDAFKEARVELSDRFAKTVPTLAQSFTVLRNAVLDYVGRLDAATGVTTGLSRAMLALASNLGSVASVVRGVGEAALIAAAGYGVFLAAVRAGALLEAARGALAFAAAIASGRAVLLGSAEAARQQAAATVIAAQADSTRTAAVLAAARGDFAKAAAAQESIRATTADAIATARSAAVNAAAGADRVRWAQLQVVAERELELVRLRAQISDTGRMLSATRLAGVRKTELALAEALAVAEGKSAAAAATAAAATTAQATALKTASAQTLAARKALTAAEAAAAGSSAALGAATGAAATASATAARQGGLLALALGLVAQAARAAWGAVSALFLLVAGNPLAALLIALTAIVAGLTVFRDKILLGLDSITTFADLLRAIGEVAGRAFDKLLSAATATFGPLIKLVGDFFGSFDISLAGILRAAARTVDFFVGLWAGAVRATVAIFEGLPPALSDLFAQALNAVLSRIGAFVNKAGQLLSTVTEFAGLGSIASNIDFTLDNKDAGAASRLGTDIGAAFKAGFTSENGALGAVDALLARSQEFAQARAEIERLAARNPAKVSEVAGPPAKLPVDVKGVQQAENALRSLLNTIQPSSGAVLELAKAERVLNEAVSKGLISRQKANEYLVLARQYYQDQIDPLGKVNRELSEQTALLGFSAKERGVEADLLRISNDLRQQGLPLTQAETQALRERLVAMRDLNAVVQAQDALLADSVGQREAFATQLTAIQALLANPTSGFGGGDAATAVNNLAPDLFAGTQTAIDAQIASFTNMYAQIDALRAAKLISDETAAFASARIDQQVNEARLQGTKDTFGQLASLASSGNKKLAAIGKAAAATQATIDGVLAVQKALAAPPGWPYNAANVIAVGVSAAANVARIAGFEEGGYTGAGGRKAIAGVVHGQEFVVNADATARNRAALEAMNSGRDVAMGGGGERVTVIVNAPPGSTVEQEQRSSPNGREIEVTIKRVVATDVRQGGPISEALSQQYGLNRSYGTAR